MTKLRAKLLRWTLPRCSICGSVVEKRSVPCSEECAEWDAYNQAVGF
jgi:hypothetical protein